MSPQDWFAKYQNTAISVDGIKANSGQCVQAADSYLMQVLGQPEHYGNAIDWWNSPGGLLLNFDLISMDKLNGVIKAGDFLVYDARVGSVYGHIDVAAQDGTTADFTAYDSNWDARDYHDAQGYPVLHQVHHNDVYNTYIVGAIRRKEIMSIWTNGDTFNLLFHACDKQTAETAQAANYVGFFGAQEGQESESAFNTIISSPQFDFLVADARQRAIDAAMANLTLLGPGQYKVN